MQAIVSADEQWGIGQKGQLLFPIPEDMKFFRQATTGKVVVMGRRTLESFPGQRPLPDRVNILLSRRAGPAGENVILCHNLQELQASLGAYPAQDVFVIGGAAVYKLLLPYCSAALVTRVQATRPADTFFPNLDETPGWRLTEESAAHSHEGIRFTFCRYENSNILSL